MLEIKTLNEVAEGLNISLSAIIDFLSSIGHKVENNPNIEISETQYRILFEEFYTKKKWITKDERFIVFLDIMGFKDFVSRETHDKVYDIMLNISNSKEIINESLKDGNAPYIINFSDSIILFSKDDSPTSFAIISACASSLFANSLKGSIPMKGAIAHGLISVNREQHIYFGQPLIDAYLLQEKEVNYYGIVAHNSIDKYFINHPVNKFTKSRYKEIKTPLKSGSIKHRNLDWFASLSLSAILGESPKEEFEELIKNLKTITSGAPRKYIDNTVDVFNSIYPKV